MRRVMTIRYISPMSAFKTALALSLAALAAWIVCVLVVYWGLSLAGIWEKANGIIAGVGGRKVLSFGVVVSLAALVGATFSLITTLLAPLVAIIYNGVVDIFGGLDICLGDIDD